MQVDLNGKTALVTRAGSYIGKAVALNLAKNGADIIVCERDEFNGNPVVRKIIELGRKAIYCKADAFRSSEAVEIITRVKAEFGKIDILVNNIGENIKANLCETGDDDIDRIVDSDLSTILRCTRVVSTEMKKFGSGCILNIVSAFGVIPPMMESVYSASNAGVLNFTRSAAVELASFGIRVNAIAAGSVTDAVSVSAEFITGGEKLVSHIPMKRTGTPEEIANIALYLVSDEACYTTGAILTADGGWTCAFARDW